MDSPIRPPSPAPAGAAVPAAAAVPAEPRQRWRIRFRRRPEAPPLPQREQQAAWEEALTASGLPLAGLDLPVPRPRIVMGAALTVGMSAEGELLDLFLVERLAVDAVRGVLVTAMPAGHELVDLHDVWLGEPSLAGRVTAADYRVELAATGGALKPASLDGASRALLAAPSLPRTRDKGGRAVGYDLRPLLAAIDVLVEAPDRATGLRIRTRFDPERGVGRPEEVLGALSELMAEPIEARSIVRERLILPGDE